MQDYEQAGFDHIDQDSLVVIIEINFEPVAGDVMIDKYIRKIRGHKGFISLVKV